MMSFLRICPVLMVSALSGLAESAWKPLTPLPEETAAVGLFAGTSGGHLVAGGGSQSAGPAQSQDESKSYLDRIVILAQPDGSWGELATRLPEPRAHAAVASGHDHIYLVGGENESGLLSSALSLSLRDGQLSIRPLPPLPHPLAYGAAVVIGQALYVVGGAPSLPLLEPSAASWKLALSAEGMAVGTWEKLPDLPDDGAFAPAVGTDGEACYVFGGGHFVIDPEARISPLPLATAYRLGPGESEWKPLASLPSARVAAASPCALAPSGELLVAGGYATVFGGAPQNHPGFETETFLFQPKNGTWRKGPPLPKASSGGQPVSAASAVVWNGSVVIVGGEVRPGTASSAVQALDLRRVGDSR